MKKWVQIILAIMGGSLGYRWSDSFLRTTDVISQAGQVFWINSLCAVGMFLISAWVASMGMKLLMRGEQQCHGYSRVGFAFRYIRSCDWIADFCVVIPCV